MLRGTRRVIKGFFEEMKPDFELEICELEAWGTEWEKVHGWEYSWTVTPLLFRSQELLPEYDCPIHECPESLQKGFEVYLRDSDGLSYREWHYKEYFRRISLVA